MRKLVLEYFELVLVASGFQIFLLWSKFEAKLEQSRGEN